MCSCKRTQYHLSHTQVFPLSIHHWCQHCTLSFLYTLDLHHWLQSMACHWIWAHKAVMGITWYFRGCMRNTETEISSFWWNFSSLTALRVVKMTTSSAASDENFVKMTFLFQWKNASQILPILGVCVHLIRVLPNFCRAFFQMHFLERKVLYSGHNLTVHNSPVDNNAALVQVMA